MSPIELLARKIRDIPGFPEQELLLSGDYTGAVGRSRLVAEALEQLTPGGLESLLKARSDGRRASLYRSLLSKLKELSAIAHHEYGAAATFSRAEARLAVRLAAGIAEVVTTFRTDGS